MKNLILTITLLFSSLAFYGQVKFHTAAGNSSGQNAVDVVELSDGSFVTVGTSGNFSAPFNDIFVLRVNAAGDTLWSRVFQGQCEESVQAVTALANDDIVIVGTACFVAGTGNDALLLKISKDGLVLLAKGFYRPGNNGPESLNDVVPTSDGGLAFAGSYGTTTFAMKTDAAGVIEWSMTYGGNRAIAIQQTSDNGYIIAADSSTRAIVLKLNSMGNLQWKKVFDITSSNGSITPTDIIENAAGYQMLGTANVPVEGDQALVMQLNTMGDTLWTKTYGNQWTNQATALARDGVHSVFVGITNTNLNLTSAAWIVKIDAQGDTLWTRKYGPFGELSAVIATSDMGYLATGSEFGFAGQFNHAYLLKTDSLGFTSGCPQSFVPDVEIKSVFPQVTDRIGSIAVTPTVEDSNFVVLNPAIGYDNLVSEVFGNVTDQSLAVDMAEVNLFEFTQDSAMLSIAASMSVDANGDFSLKGLTSNRFILQAVPDTMAFPNTTPTWSGFEYKWTNAGKITISGCSRQNASVGLDRIDGGNGIGRIAGKVVAGNNHPSLSPGDPISNVPIFLIQNFFTIVRMGYTDANGAYDFDQILLGNYDIWADIPALPIDSQHTAIQLTNNAPSQLGLNYLVDADRITGRINTNVGISPLLASQEIKIFPNPTQGDNLYFSKELHDIAVYSLQGHMLKRFSQATHINLADLPVGMYLLRTQEGQAMVVKN